MHSAVGHAQAVALPTTSILALKRPRSMAQTLVQPARPADVPPRGPTDRGSGLVVSPHLTQTRMQRKRKAASEQGVSNPPSLETSETFLPQAAPADAATASARTRAPSLTTAQKERRNFLRRLRKKELKHAASIGDEAALKRLAQIKLRRQKETQSLTQEARKRKYENERDRLARLKKELESDDLRVVNNAEEALERYWQPRRKANKRLQERKRGARIEAAGTPREAPL